MTFEGVRNGPWLKVVAHAFERMIDNRELMYGLYKIRGSEVRMAKVFL